MHDAGSINRKTLGAICIRELLNLDGFRDFCRTLVHIANTSLQTISVQFSQISSTRF